MKLHAIRLDRLHPQAAEWVMVAESKMEAACPPDAAAVSLVASIMQFAPAINSFKPKPRSFAITVDLWIGDDRWCYEMSRDMEGEPLTRGDLVQLILAELPKKASNG